MPRQAPALAFAACMAALLVACGPGTSQNGGDDAGSGAKARDVPALAGPALDGDGEFTQRDITGPALIHFAASWCPTCNSEAPAVATFIGDNRDELQIVHVAVEDSRDDFLAFAKKYDFGAVEGVVDADRSIEAKFGLTGQPHSVFINDANKIVATLTGPQDAEDLAGGLEKALA